MGSGLEFKMTMQHFRSLKSTDEKLEIIFKSLIDFQGTCLDTRKKYNDYFKEGDDSFKVCDETLESLKKKIEEIKVPETNKRRFFAGGAAIGGPSGIAFWEFAKSAFEYIKTLTGG